MEGTAAEGAPLSEFLGVNAKEFPEIKRYFLTGFIGEGGMGKVFLGRDSKLDREIAIKVISGDDADEELKSRFYREAKVAAVLNHPNIIKVMDYSGPDMPQQFIVMERLLGHDLQHYLETNVMSEALACAVAHEIAQALAHAHAQGLVHRDVKPENIFLEPTGRVVLIDFGLAKGINTNSARETFAASKTRLMGTPLFSSPEQLTGSSVLTVRSDLFSLGALLYYMVSQVTPYQGNSLVELLDSVRNKEPLPLDSVVDVSPEYLALTHQLLSRDPTKRGESADAIAERLKTLLEKHRMMSITGAVKDFVANKPLRTREVTSITKLPEYDKTVVAQMRSALGDTTAITKAGDATSITTTPSTMPAVITQGGTSLRSTRPIKKSRSLVIALVVFIALLCVSIGLLILVKKPPPPIAPAAVPELPPPVHPEERPQALPTPKANTTLYVLVKPWGKVWIDGALQGMTPAFRKIELSEGEHTIEVKHPTFGAKTTQVTLRGEPEREVVVDFTQ